MRSLLLFITLLVVLTLSNSMVPSVSNAANTGGKERGVTKFTEPVRLMGTELKGEYLFVHDNEAMARGDACTYVYKGLAESVNNLVISFHCLPAPALRGPYFRVRVSLNMLGQYEITEYQFAGSSEVHMVPTKQHAAHVTITN